MKADKIEILNSYIPALLQNKYTVIPDQINGKTFALALINKDYKLKEYYAHTHETNFYSFYGLKCFLLGM